MSRGISETVQHAVFVAGVEDAHGNPVESWGTAAPVGVYAFDPGSSEERSEGMDRVVAAPSVFFPVGTVFGSRDRVTARGKLYEVEGDTQEWVHPSGHFRGNSAQLKRVDG